MRAPTAGPDPVATRRLTVDERLAERRRQAFSRAVARRTAEINATMRVLVRERALLEEHRRLVLLGAATPEIALAALRARGVDVSPLVMQLPPAALGTPEAGRRQDR